MSGPAANRFDRQARPALIVACALLLCCYGGFAVAVSALRIYLEKKPVFLRHPLSDVSTRIGPWQSYGPDHLLDEAMVEELGTNKYLDRSYALEGRPAKGLLNVHLAYYTGMIDAVPHVPDRCFVAAGYEIKEQPANVPLEFDRSDWKTDPSVVRASTGELYPFVEFSQDFDITRKSKVLMPLGQFELRTTEFQNARHPRDRVFAGYFFIANGRVTPTPTQVRWLAFKPSEKYAYYCKVQFTYEGDEATRERFVEIASSYLRDLLPELMRCLPDWSEVERGDGPAAAADR